MTPLGDPRQQQHKDMLFMLMKTGQRVSFGVLHLIRGDRRRAEEEVE